MDFLAECPTDLKLRFGQDEETLSDFANVRTLDRYGQIGASAQILFNGVNENALMFLFRREGIEAKQQTLITVYFEEEVVGNYYADILPARHPAGGVEDKVILEIKSVKSLFVIISDNLWLNSNKRSISR